MRYWFVFLLLSFSQISFAKNCGVELAPSEYHERVIFKSGPFGVEPRIATVERWPDSGIRASLSPAMDLKNRIDMGWAERIGEMVPNSGHEVPDVDEVFDEIILSHNRVFTVTYSNYGHTRVYNARKGEAEALIPFAGHMTNVQDGILAVGNRYFVLGQSYDGQDSVTLRSLGNPIDVLWHRPIDSPLTSAILSHDETKFIYTTRNSLFIYDIEKRQNIPVFVHFPAEQLEISTATLLKDTDILLLGFHSPARGHDETYLLRIDLDGFDVSDPVLIEDLTTVLSISVGPDGLINVLGRDHQRPPRKVMFELPDTHPSELDHVIPLPYPASH